MSSSDNREVLLDLLFERLDLNRTPDSVADLVLAAYAGEAQLRAVLAGEPVELPARPEAGPGSGQVYLDRVTVAGFRGIGPQASLVLQPQPGLTIVAGRNGSGKSSFAEAVEIALTGDSQRWADKHSVFREGWRNLHLSSPCAVEVVAHVDGEQAPIRIRRSWPDEATEPSQGVNEITHRGAKHPSTDALGWRQPLDAYRPFLTANDLGRLISARPSDLFDALAPLLGIEAVTDADARCKKLRKEYDDRSNVVKNERIALRRALTELDDDRARASANILTAARPDLDALDRLLRDHSEGSDPTATACRRIAEAPALPEPADIEAVATALIEADERLTRATASREGAAHRIEELLRLALEHHDQQGDGTCPVCQVGVLDAPWRAAAAAQLEVAQQQAAAAREAHAALDDAWRQARTLRAVDPAFDIPDVLAEHGDRLQGAVEAWQAGGGTSDLVEFANHLRTTYPSLFEVHTAVREHAAAWLHTRDDAWRDHSTALHAWLHSARETRADEDRSTRLKAAVAWFKSAIDDLRAARLAPFATQSQHIWEQLRQESNVELAGMKLDGSSTRRRVAFPATIDGAATAAMAVMSQGELHALGLAVFLPRATADDSPFRFVVIDDPVQSMDPSKVDGLAQVLAELAERRQVVVFTHDNRLPEAIRRLQIDATIWEVTRKEQSEVEIRKNLDPVKRYLSDATALAKTTELPDKIRGPLVLTFCRSAIEAACHERVRRERIQRGERHADVERLLERALTTTQTAALALFGDADQGGKVLPHLDQRKGRWAADAFKACKQGAHGVYGGNLERLVGDTARLTEALR
ncbi:AAA family ATPase [Dactylosporangium sp. CA-139066]|uniref:AAA family ATPase n=1 Tax=Dactylosporangium sp. CA-139066 TaxID=3239930 RepID=UPI003D93331A